VGSIKKPAPVKLISSIFSNNVVLLDDARRMLEAQFGPMDYATDPMPFDQTNYYESEFGVGILRQVVAFERLIDPAELPAIKISTNEMELTWADGPRRRVNLDPGYVTLAKLVLATTKNQAHRIYMSDGVYAEVTLRYRDKHFQPWEWTYPDYGLPAYRALFEEIRERYRQQLRDDPRDLPPG